MAYSYGQLQQLWIDAGGPSAVAALMAAVALAESSGNPGATNPQSGACGLWQINPPESGCQDPATNAQMAVRKYNEQGLGAWEAYTTGAYRQFYSPNVGPSQVTPGGGSPSDRSAPTCCLLTVGGFCADTLVGMAALLGGAAVMLLAITLGGLR